MLPCTACSSRIIVISVTEAIARRAGELLGATGLSGTSVCH